MNLLDIKLHHKFFLGEKVGQDNTDIIFQRKIFFPLNYQIISKKHLGDYKDIIL